jgi:hypothetical protein
VIELDDRIEIRMGPSFGMLCFADGDWRYSKNGDDLKVWRWDGRRWRRVKRIPEHIQRGIGTIAKWSVTAS